ncbi:MAG: hypothetical protein M5U22_01650 [Thermoleophilia bacterium]|nr:hypothetical protein [Thermoleophilia bacterium]
MGDNAAGDTESRGGRGNLIAGLTLIVLGALFLLGRVLDLDWGEVLWPFFVILPGVAFFVVMIVAGRTAGFVAIPGSIVTVAGLVLLFQNSTDYWSSWLYMWALVGPLALGMGFMIWGWYGRKPSLIGVGRGFLIAGVILFLVFGAFFELVLRVGGDVGRFVWPLILIALGIFLLLRRGKIV